MLLGALLALLAAGAYFTLEAIVGGFWLPQGVSASTITHAELSFLVTYLVLGTLCWLGLAAVLGNSKLGTPLVRLARRLLARPDRLALGCALGAFAGSVAFRLFVLRSQVLSDDELTYDFIASTLLHGRLSNVPPIASEFLRNQFVYATQTAWHGKYPIGHPLVLAAGRLLGAQGLTVPAIGGFGVLVTYAVGRRLLDARAAAAACLLLVMSPHYVWTHATQLSQPTSMLCMLLAMLGVLRLLETQQLRWAALCGGALGFGMLARPMPTMFFVPAVLLGYVTLLPRGAWRDAPRQRALELATAGAVLLVGVGVLLWVNVQQWGSPFKTGAEVVHKHTGAFKDNYWLVMWSLGAAVLRETFWLHGWPVSLALLPFARFRRGGVLLWGLVAGELAYRLVVAKTVLATTGPIYMLEVVPLLCLASVAGAVRLVERGRARLAARGDALAGAAAAPDHRVVGGVAAGYLVGALMFLPVVLGTAQHAADVRVEAVATLERAGFGHALVFSTAIVHPERGDTWAYYPPSPSPQLDDDLIFVRYLYEPEDYERMHALWRERFPDRRAVIFLLTPEGKIALAELSVDPNIRPTLPPKILFALPDQ